MPKGALTVYLASIIGRLPTGALGLVLILRTRELTGSYAAGGLVAGAFAIAHGASAPVLGRRIDRLGQRGTLILTGIAATLLLGAFAALPDGSPTGLAMLVAAGIGVSTPPMNSCIRAIWSQVLAVEDRHRMFNIDSIVFELVYISGPLIIVGGIGAWSMQAATAACAVLTGAGSIAFAATRLSRTWQPAKHSTRDPLGALRGEGLRVLMAMIVLFGVSVGAVEIAVAAFATEHGSQGSVALLLALWGVGSAAGGIAAARARAPQDPARRLAIYLMALALLELPLAAAGSIEVMAVALTLAGVCISPSLALTFSLVSSVSPHGTVTEGMTWITSAMAGGLAIGSALSGWLIETSGTTLVLALVSVYGLAGAAIIAGSRDTLATA